MARRFVEKDHPRWPRGAGDKAGEFRDKTPDWAARVADALPAGRYGSIATGQTMKCPFCGRQVKVVGTGYGRLSTHNQSKGVRCPGSGAHIAPDGGIDGVYTPPPPKIPQQRPPSSGARKKAGKYGPPPPPKVVYGPPLYRVDNPQAQARMAGWRAGTTHKTDASRIAQIYQTKANIREWEDNLRAARFNAKEHLAREAAGFSPGEYWRRLPNDISPSNYTDAEADALDPQGRILPTKRGLEHQQRELARLESDSWEPFDPTNPLAYYGGLLQIYSDDWHTYEVLDELEQRVPAAFHKIVAEYLASKEPSVADAGLHIGSTQSILDLDDLRRKIRKPPRGWGSDATMATWGRVDGVVSNDAILAVTHTDNTTEHTQSRARSLARVGMLGHRVGGSAGLHEFGHVLDVAAGYLENGSRFRGKTASKQRRWRLLHAKVVRSNRYLSPYFKQKGDAGPQEFWADAFFSWAAVPPTPTEDKRGKRFITRQDEFISEQYGLNYDLAMEVSDYFTRLHKEVESGRRVPFIQAMAEAR